MNEPFPGFVPPTNGGGGGEQRRGVRSTQDLLEDMGILEDRRAAVIDRFGLDPESPDFMDITDPELRDAYKLTEDSIANIAKELVSRKVNPITGEAMTDAESSTALGNLSARWAEIEQRRVEAQQQADIMREQEAGRETRDIRATQQAEQDRAAKQRETNIKGTLDLLSSQIRRGELSAAEATNRIRAASETAGIQRDILRDQGPYNLPAGTEFFPGTEAGGALANAAAAFGFPWTPMKTGGTFGISPGAITAPIGAAVGQSALPGLDTAMQNAIAALLGQGLPIGAQ